MKGGVKSKLPRKKNEIERTERLNLRLTKVELEKISRIAEKKNISRTEAILQGIDLLIAHKPKRYKSFAKNPGQNEPGVICGNSNDD